MPRVDTVALAEPSACPFAYSLSRESRRRVRYDLEALVLTRTFLVALLVFLAVFVALHPSLEASGSCGSGGCPEAVHSHGSAHVHPPTECAAAVLAAFSALAVAPAVFRRRRLSPGAWPAQLFLSPDPRPPQLLAPAR